MYRVSREGRRASAHEHDPDSRLPRYKDKERFDEKNKRAAPVAVASRVLPVHSPGVVLCLKATAALAILFFVRGVHRSMCPADVQTPEVADLQKSILNLDQRLGAEREARKAAENAMKDLRAQDRGHAGMPRVPGSADGRQGRAEAEAERAGLNEGRGDLHDSGRSDDMDSGDRQDARLPKGDVENLLEEKTQALAETIKELEDSDAKNKQLLDKVTVLEQQLDERRNLAINAGHGDKSTTVKVKHHFGRAPGSPSEPADGNKKNAAGGEARQFYVNPDDKYEGHPSNGLGDPFEPMDGWIMDEVDKKGELLLEEEEEEDALNWDADGDVGSGGDGVDTLADFKVDPVATSDGDLHDEQHPAGRDAPSLPSSSSTAVVDGELVAAGGLADSADHESGFGDVALDKIDNALGRQEVSDWQVEEGVDWDKVAAEHGSGNRPAASWEQQQEASREGGGEGSNGKGWPAAREDRKHRFYQSKMPREEKTPRKPFLSAVAKKVEAGLAQGKGQEAGDATGADHGQSQDGERNADHPGGPSLASDRSGDGNHSDATAEAADGEMKLPNTHAPATAGEAQAQQPSEGGSRKPDSPDQENGPPRPTVDINGAIAEDRAALDKSHPLPGEEAPPAAVGVGGGEEEGAGGGGGGGGGGGEGGEGGGSMPPSFPKAPGRMELSEPERVAREENLERLAFGNAAGIMAQVEEVAMAKTKEVLKEAGVPVVEQQQQKQEPPASREAPETAEEMAHGNTAQETEEERLEQERLAQEEADRKEAQRLAREAAERAEDLKQERLREQAEKREAEKREADEKARRQAEKEEAEKALQEATANAAKAADEAKAAADALEAKAGADAAAAATKERRAHGVEKEAEKRRQEEELKKRDEERRAKEEAGADRKKKAEKEAALSELVMGNRKPKTKRGGDENEEEAEEEEDDDDLPPRSKKKKQPSNLRQEPKKKSSRSHKRKKSPVDIDDDDDMENSFKVPGPRKGQDNQDDEFTDDDEGSDGGGGGKDKGSKAAAAIPAAEMKRRDEEAAKFLRRQS